IRQSSDIVDVIGSYVPLKKAGRNFKALSPFKKEKTASFFVDPARQMFKCFSSGHGGDVFKFVMVYENLEFPAAVRLVAQRSGITIPEKPMSPQQNEQRQEKEQLLQIHSAVTVWWAQNLRTQPNAEPARNYLKSRKIGIDLAREFNLGYAPPEWDATMKWGLTQGFSAEAMEKAGILTRNESGRVYDRFRGRLMFPIANDSGHVVAFSGRLLDPEAKAAKYVNSPETSIFTKSRILFGLDKNKREILNHHHAILCEGQIDLIRLYEKGIRNAVASQGTAFTEHHARLLKRYAHEVTICFDADTAGQDAAVRSVELLLQEGLAIKVATMPPGQDPDTMLRDEPDGTKMLEIIHRALDYSRHLLNLTCQQFDVTSPQGRAQASDRMSEVLLKLTNPIQQRLIAHEVASRLQIPLPLLLAELEKKQRIPVLTAAPRNEESLTNEEFLPPLEVSSAIEGLFSLTLSHPPLIPHIQRLLKQEWVEFSAGGDLLTRMIDSYTDETWQEPAEFLLQCGEQEKNYLAGLVLNPTSIPESTTLETIAGSMILNLQKQWRQRRIQILEQEIKSGLLPIDQFLQKSKELLDLKRA
ncbi:MAG: DNA primase, partial [Verrucomicrobiota bacterium]